MKKLALILPLFLLAADKVCTKCALNRAQMKCEYYVGLKGDVSEAKECRNYADYLKSTKVYGKAAWYYLLAKEPAKALEAAKRAVKMGENYAYEYMAEAQLVLQKPKEAKRSFALFEKSVGNSDFFTSKHFATLKKIYKNFDEKALR